MYASATSPPSRTRLQLAARRCISQLLHSSNQAYHVAMQIDLLLMNSIAAIDVAAAT
jgi:hypothetical protein